MSWRANLAKDPLFSPETPLMCPFACPPLRLSTYTPMLASASLSLSSKGWIFWEEWMCYRDPEHTHGGLSFPVSYRDRTPSGLTAEWPMSFSFPVLVKSFREVSGISQGLCGDMVTKVYPGVVHAFIDQQRGRMGQEKRREGEYCILPSSGKL